MCVCVCVFLLAFLLFDCLSAQTCADECYLIGKKKKELNGGRQHGLVNKATDLRGSGDLDTIPGYSLQCDFRQISEQAFPPYSVVYLYCRPFRVTIIPCCMFIQPQVQRGSVLCWNILQIITETNLRDRHVKENVSLPFHI